MRRGWISRNAAVVPQEMRLGVLSNLPLVQHLWRGVVPM